MRHQEVDRVGQIQKTYLIDGLFRAGPSLDIETRPIAISRVLRQQQPTDQPRDRPTNQQSSL